VPDPDVVIVGAGPAGAVCAAILARAGARVRVFDRSVFPRDKLCGDTVNPGTIATLRRLILATPLDELGLRVDGMRVSGSNGVVVEGRYPPGMSGRAILRRDFDWMLLQDAIGAGAQFEAGAAVRGAIVERGRVTGIRVGPCEVRAPITVAADGRHSTLAFALGLASHPARPRRWAIGAYIDVAESATARRFGEMHVRGGHYIGIAPVPGNLTNVCLVTPWQAGDAPLGNPRVAILAALARDPLLHERFSRARFTSAPVVLGPLAVDVRDVSIDGLLLAGDAAGFIDPMTGDGLRYAIRGAELAADAAARALAHGWSGVHDSLRRARRREFAGKWRFNRGVRSLAGSPRAVAAAAMAARIAPAVLRRAMMYSGDCGCS